MNNIKRDLPVPPNLIQSEVKNIIVTLYNYFNLFEDVNYSF